ncbi:stage III sporulation protein AE [Paenibacillus lutrae]|uniref:Stage III sporulation protein AE n=1 Tax=Paenibacillus lutrae TaxID=2078573 RepID=A0A7X3FIC2_9BACL|nr:stage III sporulation protein AE [Paenibacillus lutrae]MVP00162.1 stage III sporulation protein AE [Paenibacillus lutrae]
MTQQLSHRNWTTLVLISALFVSFLGQIWAQNPLDSLMQQQAGNLDTNSVETFWNKLIKDYGGYFPENRPPSFADLLSGAKSLDMTGILKGALRYFFHEIVVNGKLLVSIVILTVFSMLLETLQSSFERNNVSKVAFIISYLVLLIIAVNSFQVAIDYAKSAISSMIHFMIALMPLLLSLLASTGGITSVAVLHPLIVFMIHAVGTVIYLFVFPLLFISAVLHIVSSMSDKYKVTQLANLLQKISLGVLGVFLTVFLGVISVQGSMGAITDGVTLRTAKYIAGNFVPVVGRLFSDATETVLGASLLVKNAVGLVGVVIVIVLCAFPAIKILALALIYHVCAAVMQPLGNSPIIGCLATIGKSMIYVFASLAAVGLMFFLALTIMIAAGNMAVMVR